LRNEVSRAKHFYTDSIIGKASIFQAIFFVFFRNFPKVSEKTPDNIPLSRLLKTLVFERPSEFKYNLNWALVNRHFG